MSTLLQDLRFGLRMLAKNPGFTAVAVITLALGIGANTAIFSLVHALMLKSLPVANPGQLYRVGDNDNCCVIGSSQGNWGIYSYPLYQQFRDHTPEFKDLAAFQGGGVALSIRRAGAAQAAKPYRGEFVSGNYFQTLGIAPFLGHLIRPADDQAAAAPVAVMSYRVWEQDFGSDPSVVGATFILNTKAYTIAGVAPRGLFGDRLQTEPPDFWLPLSTEPLLDRENPYLHHAGYHWLYLLGRLQPGAQPARVQAMLTTELQRWLRAQPDLPPLKVTDIPRQHINLVPGGRGIQALQHGARDGLRLLMVLSGLLMLIACANIANLLLARAAARHAETTIRVALGAPPRRMIRQVLTESVLLALLGGAAGVYVAYGTESVLLRLAFRGAHYVPISTGPSVPVLGFALALALVTGMVFGVAPAWLAARTEPAEALRGTGRSTTATASLARRSLIVLQVALSTILLIGAAVLTRSLRNLEEQNFGFERQGLLIVRIDPALAGYTPEKLGGLYTQFAERLPRIPGVLTAAYSQYSPMEGNNWQDEIHIEGHSPDEQIYPSFLRVSPHYFETIGTRLLRGRVIDGRDTPPSPAVAVVTESFVKKYLAKEEPIGKRFGLQKVSNAGHYEIVGVVQDAKYTNARSPVHPFFFLPFLQHSTGEPDYMVRSQFAGDIELRVSGQPANLQAAVRRTLADINPDLTVLDMVSMSEQVSRGFNGDRLTSRLTALFGLVALLLACVGIYGVTGFMAARRTNEIGIRMALGADRKTVLALVLRGVVGQVAAGLAIGVPLAVLGGRLMASQLYGVKSYDPVTVAIAAAVLTMCSLSAGFVPARRASKVDPMVALRYE
jgi:predicted permease